MCRKILIVVGITSLFLGVCIQPAIATVEPRTEVVEIEPIEYLFPTILDISSNPDVKNLLEQYDYNLFKVDIDRSFFRRIFFRNPILFCQLLFTKPSITISYLDKCYNVGVEISKILGENKIFKLMESIEITNPQLFGKIYEIVEDDKLLNKNIGTSEVDYPILCIISVLIFIPITFLLYFTTEVFSLFYDVFNIVIFAEINIALIVILVGLLFVTSLICGVV
jgi:hypothetical protein